MRWLRRLLGTEEAPTIRYPPSRPDPAGELLYLKSHGHKQDSLIDAGLSEGLIQVFTQPLQCARSLDIIIGQTDGDFMIPLYAKSVLPLYANGTGMVVRWLRADCWQFCSVNMEDTAYALLARSEQGLMAQILQQYEEMTMLSPEEAVENKGEWERLADIMGFKYAAEYREQGADFHEWALSLEG